MRPAERQIQWAEGMSRERFCQEATLRAMESLLRHALVVECQLITEELAQRIAKEALEIGYSLDEAYGRDTVPRFTGEA